MEKWLNAGVVCVKYMDEFYSNKNTSRQSSVKFNYSNNNGIYFIGEGEFLFGISFSGASQESIYVYNDHKTLDSVAIIKGARDFDDVKFDKKYDGTSRTRCPKIGEIVLLKNNKNKYALIKIEGIKMQSRGDEIDSVEFSYKILNIENTGLIAGEEINLKNSNWERTSTITTQSVNENVIINGGVIAGGDITISDINSNKVDKPKGFDHKSEFIKTLYLVLGTVITLVIVYLVFQFWGINLHL